VLAAVLLVGAATLSAAASHATPAALRALPLRVRAQASLSRSMAGSGGGDLFGVIVELDDAMGATASMAAGLTRGGAYREDQLATLEKAALAAAGGGRVVHRYRSAMVGFSMLAPSGAARRLRALPGVHAVYADELLQPLTDSSPAFIGADVVWDELGGVASAGEGVVVGVLDTGVWPEHPCFADPDPAGLDYADPARSYPCELDGSDGDPPFACNGKLIGAARFMATHDAVFPPADGEPTGARDSEGHGTHTATTAACNHGVEATLLGLPRGTISGVAPRAQVIAYKVCGRAGCFVSDSVAAVDRAIRDGVDVINFSIGGGSDPYRSAIEKAFLRAYEAGVFVAASAGNDGPVPDGVLHRGPWVTTVGASTTDRRFVGVATLSSPGRPDLVVEGASVTAGTGTDARPVELAGSIGQCTSSMPPVSTGAIVVCDRGMFSRATKSYNAMHAGASAMILRNLFFQGVATDNHYIPSLHLEAAEGEDLVRYITAGGDVTATLSPGTAVVAAGDVMAPFSSRGGPAQTLGIGKPDLTAPGVQILAGHTVRPAPADAHGPAGELFQAIQGTSMSSPHVAGAAALLAALEPGWSPGRIKSALMTTARGEGLLKEDGVTEAGPYDHGSGRIDLRRAGDPGVTMEASGADFVEHRDALWRVNHPSAHLPVMPGRMTLKRTVHSELDGDGRWSLSVEGDRGVRARVHPRILNLPAGASGEFRVRLTARNVPDGDDRHVAVTLSDGQRSARMPVTMVRRQPVVTLYKQCSPSVIRVGETTECTVTTRNEGLEAADIVLIDKLPAKMVPQPSGVRGATLSGRSVKARMELPAGAAPSVSVGPGSTPFGYVRLSSFPEIPVLTDVADDDLMIVGVPGIVFAGESYTSIGVASNGFVALGEVDPAAAAAPPQLMPDPAPPNLILAPAWSDHDPSRGGAIRVGYLTNGSGFWTVVDWEDVADANGDGTSSFQVWLGNNGVEDVTFAYDHLDAAGALTVGAENARGDSGQTYYGGGQGRLPTADTELAVTSTPATNGETHEISYVLEGVTEGSWRTCARLRSATFDGTGIACAKITVMR